MGRGRERRKREEKGNGRGGPRRNRTVPRRLKERGNGRKREGEPLGKMGKGRKFWEGRKEGKWELG